MSHLRIALATSLTLLISGAILSYAESEEIPTLSRLEACSTYEPDGPRANRIEITKSRENGQDTGSTYAQGFYRLGRTIYYIRRENLSGGLRLESYSCRTHKTRSLSGDLRKKIGPMNETIAPTRVFPAEAADEKYGIMPGVFDNGNIMLAGSGVFHISLYSSYVENESATKFSPVTQFYYRAYRWQEALFLPEFIGFEQYENTFEQSSSNAYQDKVLSPDTVIVFGTGYTVTPDNVLTPEHTFCQEINLRAKIIQPGTMCPTHQ